MSDGSSDKQWLLTCPVPRQRPLDDSADIANVHLALCLLPDCVHLGTILQRSCLDPNSQLIRVLALRNNSECDGALNLIDFGDSTGTQTQSRCRCCACHRPNLLFQTQGLQFAG